MKGLILKDIINMKRNAKFLLAMAVLYGFMAFSMESSSFFSGVFTLIFATMTLYSFSLDEIAKWDGYALTMPIKRENVIQGKYLFMLILTFAGLVINMLITFLMNVAIKAEKLSSGLEESAIGTAIVILFYSIIIPIIIKFGVEKARFMLVAIYMIPFIAGTGIFKFLKQRYPEPPQILVHIAGFLYDNVYIIVPVFLLVSLLISYRISIRIYRKKEF
jgi:hypothetical protein